MVEQSEGVDQRNFDKNFGWKEAFGFQLRNNGRWQKLWIRYATDQDVKAEDTKGENSRFYTIQKQKREQKMKQKGYFKKNQTNFSGAGNSNFIRKAIGKQEKFRDNKNKDDLKEKEDEENDVEIVLDQDNVENINPENL